MMLGGIQPALLVAVFAVTFATLLATAALSIAVSVWSSAAATPLYVHICSCWRSNAAAVGVSNQPRTARMDRLCHALRVLGALAKVNPFGVLSASSQARIVANATGVLRLPGRP